MEVSLHMCVFHSKEDRLCVHKDVPKTFKTTPLMTIRGWLNLDDKRRLDCSKGRKASIVVNIDDTRLNTMFLHRFTKYRTHISRRNVYAIMLDLKLTFVFEFFFS